MKLLRAATLVVSDPKATAARYVEWLDYQIKEEGTLPAELASSWGAPNSAGQSYVVLEPASGAPVYLRFVAGETPADYRPLRSYGWAAIEICVQDVLAVNERMAKSPFTIIGPPRTLDGVPTIFPMQVQGPDQEIVYLTEIRADPPHHDLARAMSLIDRLFILVLACSDLPASLDWFERQLGLRIGDQMDIVYTMLARAFDLPMEQKHRIATLVHDRDLFLELDQYPPQAQKRPGRPGHLPPGIALATLMHPNLAAIPGPWFSEPQRRSGILYGDRLSGTLCDPDGTLVEIVSID